MSVEEVYTPPTYSGGTFSPPAAGTYDLGSITAEWNNVYLGDDVGVILGSDQDLYVHHRGTAIAVDEGDTDLAALFPGTANHPALAANSLIVASVTQDADILFVVSSDGGNARGLVKLDGDVARVLVSTGLSSPVPNALLHLWEGASGQATPFSDTMLTLEKDGDFSVSFLTPNTNAVALRFGDPEDNDVGRFFYNHNGNSFGFFMAGVDNLAYSDGAFAFQKATTVSTSTGNLTLAPTGKTLFTNNLRTSDADGAELRDTTPSATVPAYAFASDLDTGIGHPGNANNLTLIAGALQCFEIRNVSGVRRVGLYGTAAVAQASAISDPAESIAANNAAIDSILAALRGIGLIAT